MSRTFTDDNLLIWEAYASGGKYGLSVRPKVIFNCISDRAQRPRFVTLTGDEADAEEMVHDWPEAKLKDVLRGAQPLD